jgi:hypothetical protein
MDLEHPSEADSASFPSEMARLEPNSRPFQTLLPGESSYDRVSSMLIALVIGLSIILAWVGVINFVVSAYSAKPRRPPEQVVEVFEDAPVNDIKDEFIGPAGLSRESRWVFVFPAGQTEAEYARLLDHFDIELATPAGSNTLSYASNFQGALTTSTGLARQESRNYFCWSSPARKKFDVQLLTKAGIKVDANSIVIEFFPKDLENKLAQREILFQDRQPSEIRRTRFQFVASGNSFDIRVVNQTLLRKLP